MLQVYHVPLRLTLDVMFDSISTTGASMTGRVRKRTVIVVSFEKNENENFKMGIVCYKHIKCRDG